jgi:hypothetical protein
MRWSIIQWGRPPHPRVMVTIIANPAIRVERRNIKLETGDDKDEK